jgi:hypothetical protein
VSNIGNKWAAVTLNTRMDMRMEKSFGRGSCFLTFAATIFLALVPSYVAMPAHAEPAQPTDTATKLNTAAAKVKPGKSKKAAAKPKARVGRAAKLAKSVSDKASKADSPETGDAVTEPEAKPVKSMDFDADQIAGQRMEPEYDPIQAAPKRARHDSLVPSSPKDMKSVVK